MKKTLAILLALIMTTSVALVSCNNDNTEDEDPDDFVVDFGGNNGDIIGGETSEPETDENGETIKPIVKPNTGNNSTTFETVNDTVYVLYTANIREEASDRSSVDVLAAAPFGASLTRSEKNSKWSKVTFTKDGSSVTGYIANDLITTNAKAVNFIEKKNEDGSAVVTKIKTTINANNAIVRKFPLADGYPNTFKVLDPDEFSVGSIVAQIPKGTDNITVVSVSEDGVWAYIKGQGKLYNGGNQASTATEVEGYTLYSNLEIAGNASSGGNSGAIG